MNVLKKCCYRSLKENPKRTAVTIIGIILATSLITAVACTAMSFRASLIVYQKQNYGDYHYCFQEVNAANLKYFLNNQNVVKTGLTSVIGYAPLENSQNPDKPYLYLQAMNEEARASLALQLSEGRMPEDDTEVVVGKHISTNGMVDIHVGDVLTLPIGSRISEGYKLGQSTPYLYEEETFEPAFEKTYTVVGIIARPCTTVEERTAPGYSVFTYMTDPESLSDSAETLFNVYASYTDWGIRHATQVSAGLLGISEDLYNRYFLLWGSCTAEEEQQAKAIAKNVLQNSQVIQWETMAFSSSTLNMLYAMAGIAITIIILTSVFCIRNSFVISLTEKMKLYGRLSSVGTTSRQQKKIVHYEAAFMGLVGIPLGVVCGIAATFILVKGINALVMSALGFSLIFACSVPAVLLAAVLSVVTIYFSASKSTRMAAKISPISAIRSNDMVKIHQRELRCPRFISRLFGIGGKVAYKNLKRARVKYRTTVISITVSVAVFIGMSTFVSLMFLNVNLSSGHTSYQLSVNIWHNDENGYEEALQIAGLEGVQEADIVRQAHFNADETLLPLTEEYQATSDVYQYITVISLGEQSYTKYCKEVGVSPSEARDRAIVIADHYSQYWENNKIIIEEGRIARFTRGDTIRGIEEADGLEIEILTQTSKKPSCMENYTFNLITLIVSDEWMTDNQQMISRVGNIKVYLTCDDADMVETAIRSAYSSQSYGIYNVYAAYVQERNLFLVVSIFLYGFITVVTLIGITSIFNTITTNMELRAPEFAMLKAVGMTRREFRRMIWLEGMFYGGKALVFGIPIGILISLAFYGALGQRVVVSYSIPWQAILTAAAAVFILLYAIMHYSMGKINKRNIIDTIRNENI